MLVPTAVVQEAENPILVSASITSNVNVTATSSATADVVMTAGAVLLSGSTDVDIEFLCSWLTSPGAAVSRGTVVEAFSSKDGAAAVSHGVIAQVFNATAAVIANTGYGKIHLPNLAAGSYVFSLRAWVHAGTGVVNASAGGAQNPTPAYLRVIRVGR